MPWKRSASASVLLVALLAASACGGGTKTSGGCTVVSAPEAKNISPRAAPTLELDPDKTYRIAVDTNCGTFTIALDQKTSPKTTASFVSLAQDGYFDDTTFHRIVPGFVIQGGDPTGTGTGAPGYTTIEPPPPETTYSKYVVAMAKGPTEPAGAAGSQFFVVTGTDIQLPAEYALLGKVTEGQAAVDRIGKLGNRNTEEPKQPVVIDTMSVQTS